MAGSSGSAVSPGPGLGDRDAGHAMFDISTTGARGAYEADDARVAVKPIVDGTGGARDATKVRLSGKALSPAAAQVFAEAFELMDGLTAADLSDIIAGRPEAEGLAVYEALSATLSKKHLHEIDLSDNALGPKGVASCTAMLTEQDSLERAYFTTNGLSAEAMESLAELLLYRGPDAPTKLTVLHFFNNMSGDGGAKAAGAILAQSPSMANFRFSSTRGGVEGGLAIAAGLAKSGTTSMVALDLNDNTFGPKFGAAIAPVLVANPGFVELNLGDISLEDEGVAAVCRALASSGSRRTLRLLNLAANDATTESAEPLARVVRRLRALKTLVLDDNSELESDGAKVIARGIASRGLGAADPLSVVSLSGCGIGRWGAVSVARACGGLPSFTSLNLNENMVSSAGVEEVAAALAGRSAALGEGASVLQSMEDNDEDNEDEEGEADEDGDGALSDDSWGGDEEGAAGDAGLESKEVDDLAGALAGL